MDDDFEMNANSFWNRAFLGAILGIALGWLVNYCRTSYGYEVHVTHSFHGHSPHKNLQKREHTLKRIAEEQLKAELTDNWLMMNIVYMSIFGIVGFSLGGMGLIRFRNSQ